MQTKTNVNQEKELILDIQNLEKKFGKVSVLNGISTQIWKGDVVVVVGPSGCGKSTFLRCLNCLEDPTGGSIIFEGEDLADFKVDINIHRQHIGMVFQQFNLFNNKTVIQNIMLAPNLIQIKDLKRKKVKNFFIKIANLFRKNKKTLIEIDTTIAKIKEQNKQTAMALLKRIGLEDKGRRCHRRHTAHNVTKLFWSF